MKNHCLKCLLFEIMINTICYLDLIYIDSIYSLQIVALSSLFSKIVKLNSKQLQLLDDLIMWFL